MAALGEDLGVGGGPPEVLGHPCGRLLPSVRPMRREERQMSVTTVQRFLMCLMASVFMLALVGAVSFVAAQASTTSNTADRHLYPN